MTATDNRSLIFESVAVIRIDIHPAGEEPDQHAVRATPEVSCTTTVCEVPNKLKLGPYSCNEVLAPRWPDPAIIVGCLILPPTNHLEAGRYASTK
jgi:hypothetical protein